ncbi:MAG: hypothetical protein AAFO01_15710, partial [Pseudomonadota bacterium]
MTLWPIALLRALFLSVLFTLPALMLLPASTLAAQGEAALAEAGTDPAKIESLVKTLEDPETRRKLIDQLKALNAVQDTSNEPKNVEELSLNLVEVVTGQIEKLAAASVELSSVIVDLPSLTDWLIEQVTDPLQREYWVNLLIKLAVTLGCSFVGYRIARHFLKPTIDRFYEERPDGLVTRVPLALLRGGLRLIPIMAFAAIGYGLLTLLGDWNGDAVNILGRSLVDATIFCMVLVVGARTVLAPTASGLRLVEVSDAVAGYVFSWLKRFIYLIAYSYVVFQNEFVLEIPLSVYGGIIRALGLVVVVMLIYLVLSNRKTVAHWLRGNGHAESDKVMHVLARCRRLIADIWPVFAIFYRS